MELEEALKKAADIVEAAKLPADLRATAFEKALDSLMGTPRATGGTTPRTSLGAGAASDVSGPLGPIVEKLGIGIDVVSEVYQVKDGALDVIIAHSRLARGAAAGARQLAVLVAAGRQAAGLDSDGWTKTAEIRPICKEFNRFDQANFGVTIAGMHEWFSMSGSGVGRKVRLTRAGWEHATQLINELTA